MGTISITNSEPTEAGEKPVESPVLRAKQLERLLNGAPFGVYLLDGNLRFRQVNPTARMVLDNLPDLEGRDFDEVLHHLRPKMHADDVVARFRHTLATGEPYTVFEGIGENKRSGVQGVYEWHIRRIDLPEGGLGVVCYFRDISLGVQAREAIEASERELRLATQAVQLGIWHWYPQEDRSTWENDRVYEIFGRTQEDGPFGAGEFAAKVLHPDDLPEFKRALAHTLETGARFFFQGRIYRKDGTLGWIELTGQVEQSVGSPLRVLGTVLDITGRKHAEQASREQRERFDLVVQAVEVGFWFCDLPFDMLMWDDQVKEHFFLPPEAAVSIETFYERLHPDDRERTRRTIAESIAKDAPYDIEYRTVASDGRQKWIRALGRTFYDANGQPRRFDGLTQDITERKQAEEREHRLTVKAVAATAKFKALFEQTPVFAGTMAADGVVLDANRLSLDGCGYRAEEVLGRHFWDTGWWRLSPEAQVKIRAATEQAAKGTAYREILPYHWADGTERLVDFALHPIRDDEGRILFLHPTGVDVTDLKRAEEKYRILAERLDAEVRIRTSELEQRNAEVLKQSSLLREFSQRLLQVQDAERRRIARELHDSAGQLLAALSMSLAQLSEHPEPTEHTDDSDSQFSEAIRESQQLVQQLSQEIRTTSYLLHPPLLDEMGLSDALRWYIQGLNERSGLEVELNVPEDFGRLPREMELVVFRLVQECLTNVHRHSGSKVAFIGIAREPDKITIQVQDHGKGMSPEKLAEIQSGGSGVGIRGMRERVRQFNGDMQIESGGAGTRVTLTIPVVKPANEQDPTV